MPPTLKCLFQDFGRLGVQGAREVASCCYCAGKDILHAYDRSDRERNWEKLTIAEIDSMVIAHSLIADGDLAVRM